MYARDNLMLEGKEPFSRGLSHSYQGTARMDKLIMSYAVQKSYRTDKNKSTFISEVSLNNSKPRISST